MDHFDHCDVTEPCTLTAEGNLREKMTRPELEELLREKLPLWTAISTSIEQSRFKVEIPRFFPRNYPGFAELLRSRIGQPRSVVISLR